jgi:hypothetical protein
VVPFVERIRLHSNLVLLLISGLLVPLITNLASSWLEMTIGQTPNRMMQLLAFGVALAVGLWALSLALGRRKVPMVPPNEQPPRMAGLVALVGRGDAKNEPARLALDYHLEGESGLQACWLIASKGKAGSLPTALVLYEQYKDRCQLEICPISDAFDLQEVYRTVREIYEVKVPDAGLEPSEVITDFTGGTAPMSAGAALACGEDEYPMQYYTGRQPGMASVPLWVQFRLRTGS